MREAELVPELGAVVVAQQATLRTLIRAALEGSGSSEELVAALVAVIDFSMWRSLVQAGVPEDVVPSVVLTISEALMARYGLRD